jgi:hypothetical protein
VLPALANPAATGPVIREAQRHLASWALAPIGLILAEEASEKLGGTVTVDVVGPVAALDHGGRARAFGAIVAALAAAKASGLSSTDIDDAWTKSFGDADV